MQENPSFPGNLYMTDREGIDLINNNKILLIEGLIALSPGIPEFFLRNGTPIQAG